MPLRPDSPRAEKIAARRAAKSALHGPGGLLGASGLGGGRKPRPLKLKAFDESKVNRDDTGKFSGDGGGGGGDKPKREKPKKNKPKQTPEERRAAQQAQAAANREAVGNELNAAGNEQMNKAGLDGLAAIRSGSPDQTADQLIGQGLAVRGRDGRVRLTSEGKKIVNAADKGDTQAVLDAVSEAGDKRAEREERAAAREAKRAEREAKRAERERARAERQAAKPKPSGGGRGGSGARREDRPPVGGRDLFGTLSEDALTTTTATKALRRQDVQRAASGYRQAVGRLAVFKDAAGADRWAAISSTAYRDRDGEIVSTAALEGAVALADATGQSRGPLRFWHVPGLDIGDCDFQAVAADGRVLIESGTFRRPAFAQAVKAVAGDYQMSIGFTHPTADPDPAGVFHTIQIFERSLVPAGRASNPFTRITTKERTMNIAPEKLTALKALLGDEGAAQLLAGVQQTDKAAQAAGVAFKSADAPPAEITLNGVTYTVKAPMPPAQMMQAAMTEAADAAAGMPAPAAAEAGEELEAEGEAITDDTDLMDLTVGDLLNVLRQAMSGMYEDTAAKMAEMKQQYEAMGKAFGQMQQQKDDSAATLAAEVATLKQTLAATEQRLKELEGDQPSARGGYRASQSAATVIDPATLKAAGITPADAPALLGSSLFPDLFGGA